jgi:hypothetical protein
MATHTFTMVPLQSTDAEFRAWVAAVKAGIEVGSFWVQTADTGQIDPATVTKPTSTNADKGYLMYVNNPGGGLPAMYMRVGLGAGSTTLLPRLSIRLGTATNGSGTLTNGGTEITPVQDTTTASACTCYCSYNTTEGRWSILLWGDHPTGVSKTYLFGIERSRGAAGAATSVGWSLFYHNPINATSLRGDARNGSTGVQVYGNVYRGQVSGSTLINGDYYPVPIHAAPGFGYLISLLGAWNGDFSHLSTYTVTHMGAARTFLGTGGNVGFQDATDGRCLMIWE